MRGDRDDINQYAVTWGAKPLRDAIAAKFTRRYGSPVDAGRAGDRLLRRDRGDDRDDAGVVDPGDEVIVFEPFYENYGPDAILSGAHAALRDAARARLDIRSGRAGRGVQPRTRAIIINTPNNPTGKVFTRDELELIAALCRSGTSIAITDEIYEHIVYDGRARADGDASTAWRDRTVTINGLSKTYSVTGWRVGWTISPPALTGAIRKVHDFLTVGAAAPLQEAGVVALGRCRMSYYTELAAEYARGATCCSASSAGMASPVAPSGAYYVMTDISRFGFDDDVEFVRHLVRQVGVAAVPGSSFYREPGARAARLRFCFAKKEETLRAAGERLARLRGTGVGPSGSGLQGRASGVGPSGSGLKARASESGILILPDLTPDPGGPTPEGPTPGPACYPPIFRPIPQLHRLPPLRVRPRALARSQAFLALVFFVALAVAHTWPLAADPSSWSRVDNADYTLNAWALAWVVHQAPRDPLHLFDANIFYPEKRTLAYSEHLVHRPSCGAGAVGGRIGGAGRQCRDPRGLRPERIDHRTGGPAVDRRLGRGTASPDR